MQTVTQLFKHQTDAAINDRWFIQRSS